MLWNEHRAVYVGLARGSQGLFSRLRVHDQNKAEDWDRFSWFCIDDIVPNDRHPGWALTQTRSKPAVPIGGKYRLVDVPISNCLHADLRRIFVLTQFNSASLNRHIAQAFRMDPFSQGFVDILAAEQTPDNPGWYQGTADAVRQRS